MRTYPFRKGGILFAVVIVATYSAVATIGKAEEPLSAHDAVEIATRDNQDLRAAQFLVDEAKGRLTQSGLFPNPELELSHASDRAFNNEGEFALSTGIKQKFPISGRITRAKDVARVDVALAEAEIKNQRRLLAAEVLKLYYQLILIDEKLGFNSDLQNSLSQLINVSRRRFKLAEVGESDLNLEKLELEKLLLAAVNFEIEKKQKSIELNRLLGRIPESRLVLGGSVPTDISLDKIEKAVHEASERRPDRVSVALRIDRAKNEARLARAERWEDWTLGVEYSKNKSVFSEPIGNQNDSFVGLRVSVPLPLWNQNQGKLAEVAAQESRARAELDSFDIRIWAEAEASRSKLVALSPILKRFETQSLTLARDNVRTLQKSYAEGLVGVSAMLQAQQQLVELQQSYIDTLTEFIGELIDFWSVTASFEVAQ